LTALLEDSLEQAAGATVARHIEAVQWFRQGNRRLQRTWGLALEIERLESQVGALESQVSAFEQSTSWRLTRPLRWFKQLVSARRSSVRKVMSTAEFADDNTISRQYEDYLAWIATDEAESQSGTYSSRGHSGIFSPPPFTLILTAIYHAPEALASNLDALRGQLGPSCSLVVTCGSSGAEREMLEQFGRTEANVTLLILPDGTSANDAKIAALASVDSTFIGFLDLPDRIAPFAIQLIGRTIAHDKGAQLLFSDEDTLDISGQRSNPFFKPSWDPELHRAGDLLGRLLVLHRDVLCKIKLPFSEPNCDWFRKLGQHAVASCRRDGIRHIPAILCHRAQHLGHEDSKIGISAKWSRVRDTLPSPRPLVTLMVPTKDRADLLRCCADSVLRGTDYPEIELLILDNGTQEAEAVNLLRELESLELVRVLSLPGPFNWSLLNNAGALAARGEVLVLLNNDVRALRSDWLNEMTSIALRPEIGAVGAKLLYPDGTLQHAGVVLDTDGVPKHVLRRAPADPDCLSGIFGVARSVSAVTGACLALRRTTFFEVGGLDENLAVAGNDVDLCLRLLAHGYRNVWTPFAVLEHQELASRGPDCTESMRERAAAEFHHLSWNWGGTLLTDPYFNPNLGLVDEQPRLRQSANKPNTRARRPDIPGPVCEVNVHNSRMVRSQTVAGIAKTARAAARATAWRLLQDRKLRGLRRPLEGG